MEYWKSSFNKEGFHYNIFKLVDCDKGMDALKELFPDGEADYLNFALFSTSGVHGDYGLIEELKIPETLTFVIVHPRTVTMRYGNVMVKSKEDIEYLKKLRASSHVTVAKIGIED